MSTAYPQVFTDLLTLFPLLLSTGALAVALWLRNYFNKNAASEASLAKIRREVAELSGLMADLEERFTRFQKREGMRAARAEKTSQADLVAQAELIMAQGGAEAVPAGSTPSKAELRRLAAKGGH